MLKFIKNNGLAEPGSRIGIALSGGSDSMALLYCFNNFRENGYFDICAVHLEHGIRGEASKEDADFVKSQCRALNIPLYVEYADVPAAAREKKTSVESAGRQIREDFFERTVKDGKADYIATAHHADDNAESVLMHVLRGSGLNGLAGIKVKRGFLIRPFLGVKKEDILNYIKAHNIPFKDDKSNKDNKYTRNYIRNVLLESAKSVFGDVSGSLNRLSRFAADDNDFIEKETGKAFDECAEISENRAAINIDKLFAYHDAIASRVIIRALGELGTYSDFEASHVDLLMHIAKTRETGKAVCLLDNLGAAVEYGKLVIKHRRTEFKPHLKNRSKSIGGKNAATKIFLPGETKLLNGDIIKAELIDNYVKDNSNKFCECFDYDKLPEKCVLRNIVNGRSTGEYPGDRIRPLGAPGSKKLNRYFTDKKIPERLRNKIPVLACGENIIWVVGYTISDDFKVDENTKNIIRLKYLRKDELS